jgi:hypothetical protein
MLIHLKHAILTYILDNHEEFQLVNSTILNFSDYIYNDEGNYLIGGEEVATFIRDACKLLSR